MQPVSSPLPQAIAETNARSPRWFFLVMAAIMVVVVGWGFGPSLYLRGLGTENLPPGLQALPWYAWAHGVALTTWFLLFAAQATLIASNRMEIHRSLGVVGAITATVVIVTTLVTIQHAIATPVRSALQPVVLFFNLMGVVQFSVLVGCALRFRRQPEVHKRLMFLANVPLLGAAVSRLPEISELSPLIVPNLPLLLLAALIARDLVVDRRLHRAVLWGGLVLLIAPRPIVAAFGLSGLGRTIAQALA